ncbi:ethanolamine ammonia-lyase [Siphonobacter sp. BAB-5385]|uniref:ethanolamine ammonia-lyase subunit EutC n=1 Tax=Siphonobacter sp. BAB-5385 TaxID=1864822 RepID=UPI000B9EA4EA|nr:ethanolamine ammonia-lyase subunit EutC [Siphonobacter sp. BAB-5385]OZI07288.1 ethanolamine ammonia-lyase [Siphonobacter sp. BAB-5385]
MNEIQKYPIPPDEWESLKTFTDARIALGKTGVSIPLRESLAFKLAHAHAKDAVYSSLDTQALATRWQKYSMPVYTLKTQALNRDQYLQRPDLGRKLHEDSVQLLKGLHTNPVDVAVVIADGLSATAIMENAEPFLDRFWTKAEERGYSLAPLCLVEQGRVAIGDEIGSLLRARPVVVLIGERPGLSSFNSMGLYLTFQPEPGLTDERRNCISNIRSQGLSIELAVDKLLYLLQEAFRLQLTGVVLKEKELKGIN